MYEQPDWSEDPDALNAQREAKMAEDDQAEEKSRKAAFEAEKERARRDGKRLADEEEESLRRITPVRASDVWVSKTRWLWRDRVPLGGLALLAGKGDVSKSTLFAQFAAWLTIGEMKGEFYQRPQTVLYVVNEDSVGQTVVPRLIAHGADLDRVMFLKVHSPMGEDALRLPRDADLLTAYIRSSGSVCTFIDPLSANVTGRKNDQGDMRTTYQEVNRVAEETNTTIWGLAHTRKAGAENIMEAIIGSSEQGNVARSVHGLVMDPEEDGARILSCEKLNLGQKHRLKSLRFNVLSADVPTHDGDHTSAPWVNWLEETNETASDIHEDQLYGAFGTDNAGTFILNHLRQNGGEDYSSNIIDAAKKKWSERTMQRARKKVGVKSKRTLEVHSRTMWSLPDIHPDL